MNGWAGHKFGVQCVKRFWVICRASARPSSFQCNSSNCKMAAQNYTSEMKKPWGCRAKVFWFGKRQASVDWDKFPGLTCLELSASLRTRTPIATHIQLVFVVLVTIASSPDGDQGSRCRVNHKGIGHCVALPIPQGAGARISPPPKLGLHETTPSLPY